MPYVIRSSDGDVTMGLGFKGALAVLRQLGPDAAVFTVFGRWVAGRRIA